MVQRFVSLLMLVSTALSAVFGFCLPAVPVTTAVSEPRPAVPEWSLCDEVGGVDGSAFYILRPNPERFATVCASDFGLNPAAADNYAAFAAVIAYCRQHPRTRVVFEPGDYALATDAGFGLDGLRDIYFDGNGARFVFSYGSSYFSLSACERVEFNDLTFDWNWERSRLGSIVRVENADPAAHKLDLVFTELAQVDADVVMAAITQYDAETLTPGAKESSKEVYLYQNPGAVVSVEKTGANILRVTHNGVLDPFRDWEVYLLRHYVYGSAVFYLYNRSSHITFDGVKIYGAAGMGFVAAGGANHFQLLNTIVGLNPGHTADRRVSATADAVHIADTGGYFRIENCDFSFMGDDAVNVHDNLGYVAGKKDASTLLVRGWMAASIAPGDVLAFKDSGFRPLAFTAAAVSSVREPDGLFAVKVAGALPDGIGEGSLLYNTAFFSGHYVIRGCRFHENRARGLLLQSGFGLCEHNEFYKIMGNAIKIVMDVSPGYWQEGTGVDQLVVRDNTFRLCSYSGWGAAVVIGTNLAGQKAKTAAVFTNIEISGNTFLDSPGPVLDADNVAGLLFGGNRIANRAEFSRDINRGRLLFGFYCVSVNLSGNRWEPDPSMVFPEIPLFSNPVMFDSGYRH
ncbi:MAG TPA: hypothetical protein PL044_09865 [Clostridiales bacterium]|nr:MAG: Alpha-1,3-galactosidase B precursor [Firmicutes bacterium ADurb.Bin262]HOU10031.1 hypothetical protein [Clostridiales bacterium]HQH62920.1 hypothetical protein [Clostridiales bacterium]HQK74059.1 hypothetical protein [Clostridiales bacterium]